MNELPQPKSTVNSVTLAQRNRAVGLTSGVAANILESNARFIQRNMRSKHPAPSLKRLSDSWFADFTDCLRRVVALIEEAPSGSILLRTFDKEDQLQDQLPGDWEEWNGERYNDLVQHIFLLDELGLIDLHPDTSLVAVSNSDWEADGLVDHLPPDSATFAIVYRDPNSPAIEFCRHSFACG